MRQFFDIFAPGSSSFLYVKIISKNLDSTLYFSIFVYFRVYSACKRFNENFKHNSHFFYSFVHFIQVYPISYNFIKNLTVCATSSKTLEHK